MSRTIAALVVASFTASLGASATADRYDQPDVPLEIQAPAGRQLFLVGHAIGTQNYICAPAATQTGVDWLFLGPQATVFGSNGHQILTHFLSPNPVRNGALQATWHDSHDSSTVWAAKIAGSSDPSYVAPGAVEWLLLEMTGTQLGTRGTHVLAGTSYIQRVNTAGGVKPPASECTPATINTRKYVAYEADYYFYE